MGWRSRRGLLAFFGVILAAATLGAGAPAPVVTKIRIRKEAHRMDLLTADLEVVATYRVAIGPGGSGYKHREGDKVTPVGRYHVISRGPSTFKIFMRLDYPNAEDRARFAKLKKDGSLPGEATIGGDIGIHGGTPSGYATGDASHDWTLGCVSVEDSEIVAVAPLVKDGTVVDIED